MEDFAPARMEQVMAADAKSPSLPFRPDGASKRHAAPDALRQLCASIVNPFYRELEAAAERVSVKI